jgi:hypothetical protein
MIQKRVLRLKGSDGVGGGEHGGVDGACVVQHGSHYILQCLGECC